MVASLLSPPRGEDAARRWSFSGVSGKHNALRGNLSGCRVVTLRAEETVRAVAVHRGAEEEAQYTADFVVELLFCELSALDELFVGVGQIVVVVGILSACRQTIGPCAELHIETVADGLLRVVGTAPVAHHHTVVLPVAFKYLVEQLLVVAVVLVLIEVVGTHESPDVSFTLKAGR